MKYINIAATLFGVVLAEILLHVGFNTQQVIIIAILFGVMPLLILFITNWLNKSNSKK